MSGRLVGEVVDWLQTPPADDLTTAEAVILLVIAERAHDKTREMWRHRIDDYPLYERLKRAARLSDAGLSKALQRLARRGLECRVPIATGKDGRPVYAAKGKSMRFRLPELPAFVTLPEPVDNAAPPVENPPDEPVENPARDTQRADTGPGFEPKGGHTSGLWGPKGGPVSAPNPSKDNPSTTDPSTNPPFPQPDVEGSRAGPQDTGNNKIGFNYASACAYLLTLPGDVQAAATAAAATELGDRASPQSLRIRAAEIAARGLTA